MKQFEYTAQCESGTAIRGVMESPDSSAAVAKLDAMGLRNVDLRETKERAQVPLRGADLIFFNEQLASLASAGLCLEEGLRQLGKDVRSPRLRSVLESVAADVESGQPLEAALERSAPRLPPLYASVVKAGVASGQLAGTLLNLSNHLRLISSTRRLISEALLYPACVLLIAFGLLCSVLILILPQFREMFAELGVPLPAVTRAMLALGDALPGVLIASGFTLFAIATIVCVLRMTARGRRWVERAYLALPLVGGLGLHSLRARFLRAMAFAVNSGLPLPEALRLSAGATASPSIVEDVDRIADRVEGGAEIADACERSALVPPMFGYVVRLRSVGSDLGVALAELAKAAESRALHGQAMLRAWLAPAAIVLVGAFIGVVIVGLFMPLVSVIRGVSG